MSSGHLVVDNSLESKNDIECEAEKVCMSPIKTAEQVSMSPIKTVAKKCCQKLILDHLVFWGQPPQNLAKTTFI